MAKKDKVKLRPYDLDTIMPRVIEGFRRKNGIPASSREICRALRAEGIKISDVRLRAIVHHIRVNHIVRGLASSSQGYWIETDPRRLMQCVKDLSGRHLSIKEAADALAGDVAHLTQLSIHA